MYSNNLERVPKSNFGKSEPSPAPNDPLDTIAMEIADNLASNFDPFGCAEALQRVRIILMNRLNAQIKEIHLGMQENQERIGVMEAALKHF